MLCTVIIHSIIKNVTYTVSCHGYSNFVGFSTTIISTCSFERHHFTCTSLTCKGVQYVQVCSIRVLETLLKQLML